MVPHIDRAVRLVSLSVVSALELDINDEEQHAGQKNYQTVFKEGFWQRRQSDLELREMTTAQSQLSKVERQVAFVSIKPWILPSIKNQASRDAGKYRQSCPDKLLSLTIGRIIAAPQIYICFRAACIKRLGNTPYSNRPIMLSA
ncbi:hypothetical protein BLA27_16660 [Brucella cytisi]|uniref:Uncharacterized protein n=1 Tax=Brucella cytisi TaxID=407152 RepID=A0A1J6HIL5_9HYPH|nr:hypothetical protein BLA27_16660 [Brucella cytisi]